MFLVVRGTVRYPGFVRTILIFVFIFSTGLAFAQTGVYRWVAPDGTVIFSDQPRPDAEKVVIQPAQTVPPPEAASKRLQSQSGAADAAGDQAAYNEFLIVSPADDETVRANNGDVTVSMSLKPRLHARHAIVLSMNGEKVGKGSSTSLTLQNLPRGTHTVQAVVVDAGGAELVRTDSVIFHVLRRTNRFPPKPRAF